MKSIITIIWIFIFSFNINANTKKKISGFVEVPSGSLFVKYKAAKNNAPTFFLVNGLTHTHRDWEKIKKEIYLINKDAGIVQFDLRGMGETLKANLPVNYNIEFDDQLLDMKALFDQLKVRGPKYLMGLSYGGGLTIYYAHLFPMDFDGYFPIAPYLEPLPQNVEWIKNKILQTRLLFPLHPATDEELYAYFLKILVYTTFPIAESYMLNDYNLEAVFRMSLGASNFYVDNLLPSLPGDRMHMIFAGKDEYIKKTRFDQLFLQTLGTKNQWMSWINMRHSKHKIPIERSKLLAQTMFKIINLSAMYPRSQWEVNELNETIENLNTKKVYDLAPNASKEGQCAGTLLGKN